MQMIFMGWVISLCGALARTDVKNNILHPNSQTGRFFGKISYLSNQFNSVF